MSLGRWTGALHVRIANSDFTTWPWNTSEANEKDGAKCPFNSYPDGFSGPSLLSKS